MGEAVGGGDVFEDAEALAGDVPDDPVIECAPAGYIVVFEGDGEALRTFRWMHPIKWRGCISAVAGTPQRELFAGLDYGAGHLEVHITSF